jgi:5-methylcytosine-specific restriction endonuclease McrA
MLRRVESARVGHRPNMFGKGPFVLVLGKKEAFVGNRRKWSKVEVQEFLNYTAQWPAFLADVSGKRYWLHAARVFSDSEGLTQDQVHALLVVRDQRNQRRVDRAVEMVQQGQRPVEPVRGHIADEVRRFVWQRDRGACRNCGAGTELQFDHIIPVAMGGSSEPENLQLLCGPCNRMKGASLTVGGRPTGPSYG